MAIDRQTVNRVAFLARLKIDEDKIEATENEFNKILNWVEQLNEVNTDDVEPLVGGERNGSGLPGRRNYGGRSGR